jgi:CheY-like chemotaxis protein
MGNVKNIHPSLIISDYRFPYTDKNGLQLIQEIRTNTSLTIPAILITADTHTNVEDYLNHNFNDNKKLITHIAIKPISPEKLKIIIS